MSRVRKQSRVSKVISDNVIEYYKNQNDGCMVRVVCPASDHGMIYEVVKGTPTGTSYNNVDFGWCNRARKHIARINNALKQDSRFEECRVRGYQADGWFYI